MPDDRSRNRATTAARSLMVLAAALASGTASAQGPPPPTPPPPPRVGGPGGIGPATPPLPESTRLPSGPVVQPRSESTSTPMTSGAANVAPSPIVGPSPRPTPPDPDAPRVALRIEDLERLALQNNPTLVQAAAVVGVSRGRAWQAGLWPNPLVGYQGEQMGARNGGPAPPVGKQMVFVQQEIPSARRQQVSRRKFEWEAESARRYAEVQQFRVLNGVRIHFYEALGAQQQVETRAELYKIADAALRTTEEMVNDGQANAPDLLQAQVQQQQNRVALVVAENALRRAWTAMTAEAGVRAMPPARLEGSLDADAPDIDFDATLRMILENSPEVLAAIAEIRRDEVVVHRERIQPIPNLYVRAAVGENFIDGGTTANLSLYGNAPVWNKNQGTILQASSHLKQAQANLRRVELWIEKRLATEVAAYNGALALTRTYRDESLPRAEKSYNLLLASFRRGRAAWPQVLVAQRLWFELKTQYVASLIALREAEVSIQGYLLVGGLQLPMTPEPLGNINVSPEPR